MKPPKAPDYVLKFIEAVCPDAPALYAASFSEKTCLTDATDLIHQLRAKLQAAGSKVDNLAALVRILVHSLRKVNPNSSNIIRAMAYLARTGLTGSILRDDEPQPKEIPDSGGHIESADCWCGPTVEEHPGGRLVIHNQTH